MTTYTRLPDRDGTLSTAELDTMFREAAAMETRDNFGQIDELKMALQSEAFFNAWNARDREFNDSSGSAADSRRLAAKWYRRHADRLDSLRPTD